MQTTVALLSAAPGIVTPVSYEVMPFLGRFAAMAARTMRGAPASAVMTTVLVGSMGISLAAAAVLLLLSRLPLEGSIDKLLPPALQAGLFSAIGWGLYTLSFETLGLEGLPISPITFTADAMRLWVPAHILGIGLWLASRRTSSPMLFPGFVGGVTLLTHAVRVASGTSLAAAQEAHWLMASAAGRPWHTLIAAATDVGSVNWSVLLSADAARELVSALLFGPVVNTLLNLVLIGPVVEKTVALPRELAASAAGSLATALGGGYSNYIAVSNVSVTHGRASTPHANSLRPSLRLRVPPLSARPRPNPGCHHAPASRCVVAAEPSPCPSRTRAARLLARLLAPSSLTHLRTCTPGVTADRHSSQVWRARHVLVPGGGCRGRSLLPRPSVVCRRRVRAHTRRRRHHSLHRRRLPMGQPRGRWHERGARCCGRKLGGTRSSHDTTPVAIHLLTFCARRRLRLCYCN